MRKTLFFTVALLSVATAKVGNAMDHENLIWSFTAGTDGSQPRGDLLSSASHVLYGTTATGGINQSGTVFEVDPHAASPALQTIYQFTGGLDGSLPTAGLIEDVSGILYGTTARNGSGNAGTVFSLTPPSAGQTQWTETTLWSFTGGVDGAQPIGSLIADRAGSGVLYGSTNFGGTDGLGAVFSLSPPVETGGAWSEKTLWSFHGHAGGSKPAAALVQDAQGNLYGTASFGGQYNVGTIFRLKPHSDSPGGWAFKVLWTFTGGADGATPMGALLRDASGSLIGTTQFGGGGDCAQPRFPYYPQSEERTKPAYQARYIPRGGNACGVVFNLAPPAEGTRQWTLSPIWSFRAGVDGGNPVAKLIMDTAGILYGLTPEYGDPSADALNQYADKGNLFALTPPVQSQGSYTETTLVSFLFQTNGTYPRSGLTFGDDGQLYAPLVFGGASWQHLKNAGYGSVVSVR